MIAAGGRGAAACWRRWRRLDGALLQHGGKFCARQIVASSVGERRAAASDLREAPAVFDFCALSPGRPSGCCVERAAASRYEAPRARASKFPAGSLVSTVEPRPVDTPVIKHHIYSCEPFINYFVSTKTALLTQNFLSFHKISQKKM